MSILITDPERPPVLLDPMTSASHPLGCSLPSPYLPCANSHLFLCACRRERNCSCICRQTYQELAIIPAMPALSAMCPSPCGRYLYQLSCEADSVHTRHLGTGELLYSTKAGVFPRDMKLRGRHLLVAGGASGELFILSAPDLIPHAQLQAGGCCCSVDYWKGGLIFVSTFGDNDMYSVVFLLSPSQIRPTPLMRLEGQFGGMCVCSDGQSAILGALDGLMKICLLTGKILWNLPRLSLCSHITCRGNMALVSGDIGGHVELIPHEQPRLARTLYIGSDPDACFI